MRGLLLLALLGWCAVIAHGLSQKDFNGKNIVLFITDQERYTMHFPPDWEERNMPGLQRLKANGVTFRHAYGNSVACSSARACLMTGLMPAQHHVRHKLRYDMPAEKFPQVDLSPDIATLGTIAKAAGYTAVYKGKIDVFKGPNSTEATPEMMKQYGFDRWNPPDSGLGNGLGELGGGTAPGANTDDRYMNSRAANESDVAAGLEGALQYVKEVAPLQQPFFLVVSLLNPHDLVYYNTSTFYKSGYNESILKGPIQLPETANESLLPTKPYAQYDFNRITDKLLSPLNTTELQLNYLNFYANVIKQSDQYLLDLLDALEPLINDTIVIKTSDHGEGGLAHGMTRQKGFSYYEEGLHIPLVYSNPRLFPKPITSDALVSHIDFAPTLADLLGKPDVAPFEGISYAPILKGEKESVQDYIVFTFEDYEVGQSIPPYVAQPNHMICVRETEWKFCKYYDPAAEVTKIRSVFEMYNMKDDPNEVTNLASPYHQRTAEEEEQYNRLKRKLKEVRKTRLVSRRVDNVIALSLNVTATTTGQKAGTVSGVPVGSGNVTLTAQPGSTTKIVISSGTGIIRGLASKGTVKFTSGTGTYHRIRGEGLTFIKKEDGLIYIDGKATY